MTAAQDALLVAADVFTTARAPELGWAKPTAVVPPVAAPPAQTLSTLAARLIGDQYDAAGNWAKNEGLIRDLPTGWDWATQARPGIMTPAGKFANPWTLCGAVAGAPWVPGCKLQVRNMRMFYRVNGVWRILGSDVNKIEGGAYAYTATGQGGGALTITQNADYAEIPLDVIRPASNGGNGGNVVHLWKGGQAGWWPKPQYPSAEAFAVVTEARVVGTGQFVFQASGDVVDGPQQSASNNPPLGNPALRRLTGDFQRFGFVTMDYATLKANAEQIAASVALR